MAEAVAAGSAPLAADVLRHWGLPQDHRIVALTSGGFSGTPVLRVDVGDRPLGVLKRIGDGSAALARARSIHALVHQGRRLGVALLPEPRATPSGDTLAVARDGGVWELVAWVDGHPVERPTPAQVAAALHGLARVHAAWSPRALDTARRGASMAGPAGVPPAVSRRLDRALRLAARPWHVRRAELVGRRTAADELREQVLPRWDRALDVFATADGPRAVARIAAAPPCALPLQMVIRDVWAEHVLYGPPDDGPPDQVAGIIDLQAAAYDTPATDIARLVGSWRLPEQDGRAAWAARFAQPLEAYAGVRALSAQERELVPWLHATGVVFGLDNWFQWCVEAPRPFPDPIRVGRRIDDLLDELPAALHWLASTPPSLHRARV